MTDSNGTNNIQGSALSQEAAVQSAVDQALKQQKKKKKKKRLIIFLIFAALIIAVILISNLKKDDVSDSTDTPAATYAGEEQITEAETKSEKQKETKNGSGSISVVDPELKAFLDSYEAFIDEYIVFMKKYKSDPQNAISLLGEYTEFMKKSTEFSEKVAAYDTNDMSAADSAYYIEVTGRCSQKLLEASVS